MTWNSVRIRAGCRALWVSACIAAIVVLWLTFTLGGLGASCVSLLIGVAAVGGAKRCGTHWAGARGITALGLRIRAMTFRKCFRLAAIVPAERFTDA